MEDDFSLTIEHTSILGKDLHVDQYPNGDAINLANLAPSVRVIDLEMGISDLFWVDQMQLHYTLQQPQNRRGVVQSSRETISNDDHVELFGLHPGEYQLQIKAIRRNGKQLGETVTVPLYIRLPLYHRPLFWLFSGVALAFLFSIYLKLKTKRLQKRQQELEVMVTEKAQQIVKDQKIIQTQAEQIQSMQAQLNHKEEQWLQQFQELVAKRLSDTDLFLPDIIDEMDISRSAFYERVKLLTQMTPNQYIQDLRLKQAKQLLEGGSYKTVKEVALAVGIKRPRYFSKLFKERFGILPSAYFRSSKKDQPI